MNFLKNETTKKFVIACFYIVLGILICLFPEYVKIFVCYLFGGILIFVGVVRLLNYYFHSSIRLFILNGPMNAFLSILFGLTFIIFQDFVITIYPILIGVYLGLRGIGKLIKSRAYKLANASTWWFDMIIGCVLLALALTLIIGDAKTNGNIIIYITGGCLIVQGLISIVTMIYLSFNADEIKKIMRESAEKKYKKDKNDDDVIDV